MNRRANLEIVVAACVSILVVAGPATGRTILVDPNGSADFTGIQAAIDDANNSDQIEVAPGTYNEVIDFSGKPVWLYSSGGPDVTTIDGNGLDWSVVSCVSREDGNTVLEGFTITGGRGTTVSSHKFGGGMYNLNSSPTVIDCNFTGNSVTGDGGGMYDNNSSPTVTDCNFFSNFAAYAGGGMDNRFGSRPAVSGCVFRENMAGTDGGGMENFIDSNSTVTNCTFIRNVSDEDNGGGMHNYQSEPVVTDCNFVENTALYGAGMRNINSSPTVNGCMFLDNIAMPNPGHYYTSWGGGMYNSADGNAVVTHCTFRGNLAAFGSGIHNVGSDPIVTDCLIVENRGDGIWNRFSSPILTNCTIVGNFRGILNNSWGQGQNYPMVVNCILWNSIDEIIDGGVSSTTVTYSDVRGGWAGEGNIDIYPMFVNDGVGDYRLSWCSACIDTGDNNAPGLPAEDLAGNTRVMDGDGDAAAVVDMGVYEAPPSSFRSAQGVLQLTIEPNGAVSAGAMWKIADQNEWYSSGDAVDLAPGYYEVEFAELDDWYEPETVDVGYDVNDPNNKAERGMWVRVLGDMTAVVGVEYKPLIVYDIGQIPPQQVPHGSVLEFAVDANWLGEDLLFSATTTFDANYPEPDGLIVIDANSGRFTYEPDDANDRVAFEVTFRAESDTDANEQTISIAPLPDLAPEYEIVSRPVQAIPDPCSHNYIFVNEIISDANVVLNGIERPVRSVTIAGSLLRVSDAPLSFYNDLHDINDMTICAKTLVLDESLNLPQTSLTICAMELVFEGAADVNTSPMDDRVATGSEMDGLSGGDIRLYIESYTGVSRLNGRLNTAGSMGYDGGSSGYGGVCECSLEEQPLAWVSPYALKMVLSHAKDTYLYGYADETRDILEEQDDLLRTYKEQPEFQDVPEEWQFEFEQMQQEIITLLHRLDNQLDYFGNPPDWVPALSFEVLKSVYDQEIDHAIRVLYLSYWLENEANDIADRAAGLASYRSKLWDQTVQFKQDYYTYNGLIGPLEARSATIAGKIGRADSGGCYGLLCDLKQKEATLLDLANRRVDKRHNLPVWKTAIKSLATIATYTFIGASKGGGKVGAAAGAAGGLTSAVKDLFIEPDPWQAATSLTDVAEKFNGTDFSQATGGWMDQFEDVDLTGLEAGGANGYLHNLRASAHNMAGGLWEVKETLKTTTLDDEEVDAELKRIKAADPTFNRLVDQVTALKVEKEVFSQQLAAAMQQVSTLSNSITNNVLAIDAMNRDASHLNRILNPRVLMYIRDMERRALARLRKYHYYMAKAYEYRLLEPYPGDLNIDDMFAMMTTLASADGTLSQGDFDALKAVYEEQLSTLAEHILDEFFLGGNVEKNVSTPYALSAKEIAQLNAGEPLTINLFERGLFPPDRENIRIVNMKVADDVNVVVTGSCGGWGNVVLRMYHPSISRLQWKDNVYTFRHLAQDTKDLLDIEWASEYDAVGDVLYHNGVSASSESLLWSLLSEADRDHALVYSRPGAWADIVITKTVNKDRDCGLDIAEMTLIVEYDYYYKEDDLQTLRVATEPNDLAPYFLVDMPDANGRTDGEGDIYRIYDWYLTPDVDVTAPQEYGNWRFERWTDRYGYTLGYDHTLEVLFIPDPYFRDDQTVYAEYLYEGPAMSPADFDLDFDVDFDDYAALTRAWLTRPGDADWDAIYDVSDPVDYHVDVHDLKVLCGDWLMSP